MPLRVLLLILAASCGSAQSLMTCDVVSQPLTLRSGSLTESLGDIVLLCRGGPVPTLGAALPQVNLRVTLNTTVTSRLLNSNSITDALLFIDDPQPSTQYPCAPATGNTTCAPLYAGPHGTATITPNGADTRNIFQGVRTAENEIIWYAIPLHASSAGFRLFRIKNLRAATNASFANNSITATVSVQFPPPYFVLNNSTVTAGFIQQGLDFDLANGSGGPFDPGGVDVRLSQCDSINAGLASATNSLYGGSGSKPGRAFQLRFREQYASAFKRRDSNPALTEPGLQQNIPQNTNGADPTLGTTVESGFYNTALVSTNGLNRAGRANSGTRLRVVFGNVPANVRIYVSAHTLAWGPHSSPTAAQQQGGGETTPLASAYAVANGNTPTTVPLHPTSSAETGPLGGNANAYPSGATAGLVEVPIVSNTGSFTWEVFSQDPNAIDTLSFAVAIAYSAANNPATGDITVNGSFAPFSADANSTDGTPLPRFTTQTNTRVAASIGTCQSGCTFILSSSSTNAPNSGAAFTVWVTPSSSGCNWNVSSNTAWAFIASPPSNTGPAPVTFSVQMNPTSVPRSAILTIAGRTHLVTQGCTFAVSPTPPVLATAGGSFNVNVTTATACAWAANTDATWLTITSGSPGTGPASVSFTAAANPSVLRSATVIIADQTFSVHQSAAIPTTPLQFVPTKPCRLMETRSEYNFEGRTGPFGPPFLRAGEIRTLTPAASNVCQIPSTAAAYVLNVTIIPRAPVDHAILWPAGDSKPNVWTIRSLDAQIVANQAIVKAGNGAFHVTASQDTDMIVDISGYFADRAPAGPNLVFHPLTPCRVIETRSDYRPIPGPFGPPTMAQGETRRFRFPTSTHCTVPNATAYSITLTVVPPQPLAFMTLWPAGVAAPNVSSINSFAGRTLANNVIVPASTDGSIDVFAFNRTDFLVDINGYFAPDTGQGLYYFPVPQCRAGDSTLTGGIHADDTTRTIAIPSSPNCNGIPATAKGYALSITAMPGGSAMPFATVYPTGQPRPNASVLNAFEGQTVTSSTLVPSGTNGAVDVYTYRRTHIVVDVSGYFATP